MRNFSDLKKRRILVTGVTSIHGWPIYRLLQEHIPSSQLLAIKPPKMTVPHGDGVVGLCITDGDGLRAIKNTFNPTHVIHCSGVCDLDVCEERPQWAYRMNTVGSRMIAGIFGADAAVVYLSTDLVFSGDDPPAGGYCEKCPADPLSVTGKTFLAAEAEIKKCRDWCIVRLGLPIGASITGDKGAIDFIEGRLRRNLPLTLFYDEWRSCISCEDIASVVFETVDKGLTGLFHLGGPTPTSLYHIGLQIQIKGGYPAHLLKTISRREEKNGPPRIGNVAMNSEKISSVIGVKIRTVFEN